MLDDQAFINQLVPCYKLVYDQEEQCPEVADTVRYNRRDW
ncbi:MAG: hypothetical protein ACJAYB_001653 [Psychromonas sp.]|jgi:hypothetical protein